MVVQTSQTWFKNGLWHGMNVLGVKLITSQLHRHHAKQNLRTAHKNSTDNLMGKNPRV